MRNNAKEFKQKKKNRLYFSNLTVIMLCCVIFFSISLIINIAKAICFNHKLNQVQKYYKEAMILKRNLNDEIQNYGIDDIESFMRNNFKMAGENEIRIDLIED